MSQITEQSVDHRAFQILNESRCTSSRDEELRIIRRHIARIELQMEATEALEKETGDSDEEAFEKWWNDEGIMIVGKDTWTKPLAKAAWLASRQSKA